jgi:hypothetical protein
MRGFLPRICDGVIGTVKGMPVYSVMFSHGRIRVYERGMWLVRTWTGFMV